MKQCNECNRKNCYTSSTLGPLPRNIRKGGHMRGIPKKARNMTDEEQYRLAIKLARDCNIHIQPKDFKVSMALHLLTNSPQALHDSLAAAGLVLDPARNRHGFRVEQDWRS